MSRIEDLESSRLQCKGAHVKRLFVGEIVGRFCETPPCGSAFDTDALQHPLVGGDRSRTSFAQFNLVGYLLQTRGKDFNFASVAGKRLLLISSLCDALRESPYAP